MIWLLKDSCNFVLLVPVATDDVGDVVHVDQAANTIVVEHVQNLDLQTPFQLEFGAILKISCHCVWVRNFDFEAADSCAFFGVFVQDSYSLTRHLMSDNDLFDAEFAFFLNVIKQTLNSLVFEHVSLYGSKDGLVDPRDWLFWLCFAILNFLFFSWSRLRLDEVFPEEITHLPV